MENPPLSVSYNSTVLPDSRNVAPQLHISLKCILSDVTAEQRAYKHVCISPWNPNFADKKRDKWKNSSAMKEKAKEPKNYILIYQSPIQGWDIF